MAIPHVELDRPFLFQRFYCKGYVVNLVLLFGEDEKNMNSA